MILTKTKVSNITQKQCAVTHIELIENTKEIVSSF